MLLWRSALLFLVTISTALADCQMSGYRANYSLYSDGRFLGNAQDRLTAVHGAFRFTSDVRINVKVLFVHYRDAITATSLGVINNQRFYSQHFIYKERRNRDYINRDIKPGQYDSQTIVLSLRSDLQAGRVPASKARVWYNKKLQTVAVSVVPRLQTLKTKLGSVVTTRINLSFADGSKGRYWFAKQFHYLPVASETVGPKGRVVKRFVTQYRADLRHCVF